MIYQFAHWTDEEIVDRFLAGLSMFRIMTMTGRPMSQIKQIVTRSDVKTRNRVAS